MSERVSNWLIDLTTVRLVLFQSDLLSNQWVNLRSNWCWVIQSIYYKERIELFQVHVLVVMLCRVLRSGALIKIHKLMWWLRGYICDWLTCRLIRFDFMFGLIDWSIDLHRIDVLVQQLIIWTFSWSSRSACVWTACSVYALGHLFSIL